MSSEHAGSRARLDNRAIFIVGTSISRFERSPSGSLTWRERLSIPLLTIVAIGFGGSLALGAGKPASGHPAPTKAAMSASIDGKPVQIGGPALTMIQRQFMASSPARQSGK